MFPGILLIATDVSGILLIASDVSRDPIFFRVK
jgi:hypothetical protein